MRDRRRSRGQLFAEINVVPFTDVVLVLLIIFMITANFIATGTGLNIELPDAASAVSQDQTQTAVFITHEGDVYLNSKPVNAPALQDRLRDVVSRDEEMVVVVSADQRVEYERVIEILDAVRNAGVRYLALAAELKQGRLQ
ncbi:MAG: ExbD/TolR family protein [Armatimonadota bacterium]